MTGHVFKHPFSCLIAGPSQSGKTTFVERLIEQRTEMILPTPSSVVWHYSEFQPAYERMVHDVTFKKGVPTETQLKSYGGKLVIIDDLMSEMVTVSSDIFTKHVHHSNMSVIYIVQNLFNRAKNHRTMSLNANYIVLFKNPRDKAQVSFLARQVFPHKPKILQQAYNDATSQPHSYLLLDFQQSTPENRRLKSEIFPGEKQFIYLEKKL